MKQEGLKVVSCNNGNSASERGKRVAKERMDNLRELPKCSRR